MVLLLVCAFTASSCMHQGPPPVDGGSIVVNGKKIYWEEDEFPLYVLMDKRLPINHTYATEVAVIKWNSKLGDEVFKIKMYDFSEPAPRTHGYVTVSIKQLGKQNGKPRLGQQRAILYEDSSKMKVSEVFYDIDNPTKDELVKIMVHELGHSLALEHDPGDSRSIMYPKIQSSPMYIMPDDVERVRAMMDGEPIPANPDVSDAGLQIIP